MKFRGVLLRAFVAISCAVAIPSQAQEDAGTSGAEMAPAPAAAAADTRPEIIPTSAFAERSVFGSPSISPDGSKFAFVRHSEGKALIVLVNADTRETEQMIDVGKVSGFAGYSWAGSERILFTRQRRVFFLFFFLPKTELNVFDLKTRKVHSIGFEKQGLEGDDVLHIDPDGRHVVISLSEELGDHPSVWRFPLDGSGPDAAVRIQQPRKGIDEWWADSAGNVRLGMKYRGTKKVSFYYRAEPGDELRHIAKVRTDRSEEIGNWDIMGLSPGSDIGYAVVEDERGRMVLREFDFSTGQPGKLVYANPDWDVEAVSFSPDRKLQGAMYTAESPQAHWLDPDMARVQADLERALGPGNVQILSMARNGRMLVWHGSGGDPGVLYVYRPAARSLDTIGEVRPGLDFKLLASPRAITYTARDGTMIRGNLTLPPGREAKGLPLIVLPHGGPFGIRDTLTYNDEVQVLATRGYAVLQPNYRGSGGFGDAFEKLGNGQIGRAMQDDLDDAMDWAVAQGLADPKRVCVVGASYGGYAALWAVTRNPERYRCAASWAGVTDWDAQLKYDRDFLTRRASKRWKARVEGEDRDFDLDDVSPALHASRLVRPVLLAHGDKDDNVPFSQYKVMKDALDEAGRPVETLVIEGEGHGFSKPQNEQAWYDALVTFLAEHNPPD